MASAIAKYHVTELARKVVNDGMDVIGGKGICLGPSNFLGRAYQQVPVGITVEGANILTRSLILFGQGAIRCHPYVLKEMQAANNPNAAQALRDFDAALFGHIGFTIRNGVSALWHGLTGARFVSVPANVAPEARRYYQQVTRFSASFAFISDVSMLVLGGSLKRREKMSARLGDILAQMYLMSAALKRYKDVGQAADAPLLHWNHAELALPGAGSIQGRDRQLSEQAGRHVPELCHLPVRSSLCGAVRRAWPSSGEADDLAVGDTRPVYGRLPLAENGRRAGRRD